MVLWEITLGTAYFLGLKRTYKLALKIQRRLISAKHPKIRQFLHRRTRSIFDVALSVHKNIQQRDLEVGRNLGNWILRWLDRMKPAAQIRGPPVKPPNSAGSSANMTRQMTNSSHMKTSETFQTSKKQDSDRHLFVSTKNLWAKSIPSVAMMLRGPRPAGSFTHYRHFSTGSSEMMRPSYNFGGIAYGGVIRKDIMQFLLQN